MPLLHLQFKAPTNEDGDGIETNNPTFRVNMGHEFFTQPLTLRSAVVTSYEPTENGDPPARLYTGTPSNPTRSDNTLWIDFLSDQQLNSRQCNTNVNDASSIPIPYDFSVARATTQTYTALDYTFNFHHIEPGNLMNVRILGSDSSVDNWTKWSSDYDITDALFQVDLTFEYDDIGGAV